MKNAEMKVTGITMNELEAIAGGIPRGGKIIVRSTEDNFEGIPRGGLVFLRNFFLRFLKVVLKSNIE